MPRDAEIRLRANDRDLDATLDKSRAKMRSKFGALGKDLARSIGGALQTGLNIAGIGSVAAIAAAGRQVYNFQLGLTRLQISAGKTKGEMQLLERQLFQVGKSTATDPDQLLAGAQAYTALTGDLATFTAGLDAMAKVSTATGANMADLSRVAAGLKTNLGIKGENFGEAFDILAKQGKTGAVELNEMATILAGLTPQFATFGTTGTKGLRELSALLQLTRVGFGSSAEAATGLTGVMTALVKKSDQFKAKGIHVLDNKGQMRDLATVIYEIGESKVFKGHESRLLPILGRVEAYQALLPLLKAGRAEYEAMANVNAKGTIGKDFNTFMGSTAGKMQSAGAAMKEAFNEALKNNIAGIASAMQGLAKAIGWIGDHAGTALAGLVALKLGPGSIAAMLGGVGGGIGGAGGSGAGGKPKLESAADKAAIALGKFQVALSVFAASYGITTAVDDATGGHVRKLGESLGNLAAGRGFHAREDLAYSPEEGRSEKQLHAEAIENMQRRSRATIDEAVRLGYRGPRTTEAISDLQNGGLDRIRKARIVAIRSGVNPDTATAMGTDELLRQFPLASTRGARPTGIPGVSIPGAGAAQDQLSMGGYDRERTRSKFFGAIPGSGVGPAAGAPVTVNVIVKMDTDGRLFTEIVDNAPTQGRR